MKTAPFYVIGNWKSNKTIEEAVIWVQDFTSYWKKQPYNPQLVKVILCAGYTHLTTFASLIQLSNLPLELGAQDVSPYPSGTYTGAISAVMLKGLVRYVLIGHSERRKHFRETEEELHNKVEQAKAQQIKPIYCVQNDKIPIPESVSLVGYEPSWAISGGDPYATKPETPENANNVADSIKRTTKQTLRLIYGGSTTPENVVSYRNQQNIDGVLPGGTSLKADTFYNLILNASSV